MNSTAAYGGLRRRLGGLSTICIYTSYVLLLVLCNPDPPAPFRGNYSWYLMGTTPLEMIIFDFVTALRQTI